MNSELMHDINISKYTFLVNVTFALFSSYNVVVCHYSRVLCSHLLFETFSILNSKVRVYSMFPNTVRNVTKRHFHHVLHG